MKSTPLFLLILILNRPAAFAQAGSVLAPPSWAAIDSLVLRDMRPQSAFKAVQTRWTWAKQKNDPAEDLRCQLYAWALQEWQNDFSQDEVIRGLQAKTKTEKRPLYRSLVQLMLASQLTAALEQQRWNIQAQQQKAKGSQGPRKDWTLQDYQDSIGGAIAQAEKQAVLLQSTPLSAIPHFWQKNTLGLPHTTAHDLLLKIKLAYLAQNWTGAAGRVNEREITRQVYAQWQKDHEQDADPSLLVWIKTAYWEWEKTQGLSPAEWTQAMEKLAAAYPHAQSLGSVLYALAAAEMEKAASYRPWGDTAQRWAYLQALAWINKGKKQLGRALFEQSGLARLYDDINAPSLSLAAENRQEPGKPFRLLVRYRNLQGVYLTTTPARDLSLERHSNRDTIAWPHWSTSAALFQALPQTGDYQEHAVEIKIDALAAGTYTTWAKGQWVHGDAMFPQAYASYQVSRLALVRDENKLFLRDAFTGQALSKVNWTLTENDLDFSTVPLKDKKVLANGQSDESGRALLPAIVPTHKSLQLHLVKGQDKWTEALYVYRPYHDESKVHLPDSAFFVYSDRSLYRPGQLVLFTGVGWVKEPDGKTIALKDGGFTLLVFDGNNKLLDSFALHTAHQGEFAGQWNIPPTAPPGYYRFQVKGKPHQGLSFRVEAYKRPDFLVQWEAGPSVSRISDSLRIGAWVLGYGGNKIAGAQWEYEVVTMGWGHSVQRGRLHLPSHFPVLRGKGKTDARGRLAFVLPPAQLPNPADSNAYHLSYAIGIKIILPNGSTLEKTLVRHAANKQYQVQVGLKDDKTFFLGDYFMGALPPLQVEVRDGANQRIDTTIHFSLYYKSLPQELYRQPFWQDQDQFLYSRSQYESWFPWDPYHPKDRDPTETPLFEKRPLLSSSAKGLDLNETVHQPGIYKWVFAVTDPYGVISQQEGQVRVFDPQSPSLGFGLQLQFHSIPANHAAAAKLVHAFPVKDIPLLLKTTQGTANHCVETPSGFKVPVASDTALRFQPITYQLAAWYRGRFYSDTHTQPAPAPAPWKATVDWDKRIFQPREKAQWRFVVKDERGKVLPALVWGTVFDARLETLFPHQWSVAQKNFPSPVFFQAGASGLAITENRDPAPKRYVEKEWGVPDLLYDGRQYWHELVKGMVGMQKNSGPLNETVVTGVVAGRPGATEAIQIRGTSSLPKQEDAAKSFSPAENPETLVEQRMRNEDGLGKAKEEKEWVRKDFRETAYFLPATATDSTGPHPTNFAFPDELTQWKWMAMAATPDGQSQLLTGTVQTQKKFLLQTNWPRFLREGDQWECQVMLSNGDSSERTGTAVFELIDPLTQRPVDGWFQNSFPQQYFTVAGKGQSLLRFPLQIPFGYNRNLLLRISARAGDLGDALEMTLPVLSRRELIREAIPLVHVVNTRQSLVFPGWETAAPPSLSHEKFTVNISAQPLQDLLVQLDSLAPAVPTGPLDWLNVLRREGMRKTLSKANAEKVSAALQALQAQQKSNGLFPWYAGGPGDAWITAYLLRALGPWRQQWTPKQNAQLDSMGKKAVMGWRKNAPPSMGNPLSHLYLLKLWGIAFSAADQKNWQKARQAWQKRPLREQVDLALSAPSSEAAIWVKKTLLPSFKERASIDSNGAWQWKEDPRMAPRILALFAHEPTVVKGILVQLLGEAQTIETAKDPYAVDLLGALFSQAPALAAAMAAVPQVMVRMGNAVFSNNTKGSSPTAATLVASISGEKINPETGKIVIQSQQLAGQGPPLAPLYGSAQWWYREDMAALPPAGRALQLQKKYYRAIHAAGQTQWEEIAEPTVLPVGEKLRIELSIWSQQALSHVVCQDDRFSSAEPVEQWSAPSWDAGTAAYRYLTDSTMVFSLPQLRKGWTRLSYEVYLTQAGIFHSGISRLYTAFSPAYTARDAGRVLRTKPVEE